MVVGQVGRLLAWEEVAISAREALVRYDTVITGQLVDVIVDHSLEDRRFEVRFQCGRAMDYLRQKKADIQ